MTDMVPAGLPAWLPDNARLYLAHIEKGQSIRALARTEGCHASTVLRKVRSFENRRDDPLIDEALDAIGRQMSGTAIPLSTPRQTARIPGDPVTMTLQSGTPPAEAVRSFRAGPGDAGAGAPAEMREVTDEATVLREARRVLRRLCETGTVLAIAPEMPKAVVLKGDVRMAVVERSVAQAFAVNDWIHVLRTGRVTTYAITSAGRAALKRMLAVGDRGEGAGVDEAAGRRWQAGGGRAGQGEARADGFAEQHRVWGERHVQGDDGPRRVRYNLAESPMGVLARRRDRDGTPFLTPDMVAAGERLREDFELSQIGPKVAQNWDRFLTGGDGGGFSAARGPGEGPKSARDRVAAALSDLGPGLGDMVLRCCCFLEGLEAAEQRLGWSARSGKIVLRIALTRLVRHYHDTYGKYAPMIG
jgi:hypothetical protein